MASQSGRRRVGQKNWPVIALALYLVILIFVYSLILLTGDHSAKPKLGIDLQGGTRVTLVPQGEEPTKEQLDQARNILQNRVNGMGVSGAEVVTDGNTLVITVPGEDTSQARALGQTSQLLFRPVLEPGQPDPEKLLTEQTEMAERWVSLGVISPDEAQTAVNDLTEQLNLNAQQQAEAIADMQAQAEGGNADGDGATSEAAKPEIDVEKIEAPTVDATAPEPPANSIEAAERRAEVTSMLREDRQSEDPTTQLAAASLLVCNEELDPIAGTDDPAKPLVACDVENGAKYILGPSPLLVGETDPVDGLRLSGNEIDTNRPINGGLNSQTGQMEINFSFKSGPGEQGGATWAALTQEYLKRQVAITLDSEVISAPVIQSPTPVGSGTSITGSFTQQEAMDLASNLRYGALPLSFAGENGERGGTATTIPATLGFASLKAGLIAGIIGLILVSIFCLAYYRVFGFLTVFTLFAAGSLIYGSLVLLGRWIGYSLDLAGVAGLIIGIGTTADSFVVFYERIKDEVREGRTFRSAVPRAWARAKHTILSGNFVSLIAAVVLYVLAVGDVKGFAFTLGLTTVFDLLVIFLVTSPLVILASRRASFADPRINGLAGVMKVAGQRRERGEWLAGDHAENALDGETDAQTTARLTDGHRDTAGSDPIAPSTSGAESGENEEK
ncbi:protein translocase subunit SecD [Corynebacterium sp. TAE3-ERU16]|uniref:protein translocase subunit SecD n=1 Tax=Corynebacterium sp. TAE3-ERU16 TaxID=2849493 RepID=UPI001C46E5F1|nr:protein translocase subunit SecD [Corynebacterium sp. TAE3-ERU16]MBV7293345.1 protein translocase subunit SecD [Corynebacterium sp. TAE3-ERU16]